MNTLPKQPSYKQPINTPPDQPSHKQPINNPPERHSYKQPINPRQSSVSRRHPQRKQDLRSDSQDHHPSKNSVQETKCCNSTSKAPDDGRIYPKHVELRIP